MKYNYSQVMINLWIFGRGSDVLIVVNTFMRNFYFFNIVHERTDPKNFTNFRREHPRQTFLLKFQTLKPGILLR